MTKLQLWHVSCFESIGFYIVESQTSQLTPFQTNNPISGIATLLLILSSLLPTHGAQSAFLEGIVKRFALLSFSLLCLAFTALVGFHIGQGTATAQSGLMSTSAVVTVGFQKALLVNGEIWKLEIGAGWLNTGQSSPVPVTDVVFLFETDGSDPAIIDRSGNGWGYRNNHWTNYGPPPVAVTTQPTTWSAIKAQHR